MTDENGHRHIPIPEERIQPSDYVGAAAEVGSEAIKGMAPAEKGWILASVIVILGAMALLEVTNYLENTSRSTTTAQYFTHIEAHRSEENRRLQEQNRILAQALARQSDRISRKVTELPAGTNIDDGSD